MWLAGLCAAITMSGGAVVPDRRTMRLLEGQSDVPPPLYLDNDSGNVSSRAAMPPAASLFTIGQESSGAADATNVRKTSTLVKGDITELLEARGVRESVDALLRSIEARMPGYATQLEVVSDPDQGDHSGFLMLSVCMGPGDAAGAAFVDELIDQHWLPLPSEVRGVLGVGRELVPVE